MTKDQMATPKKTIHQFSTKEIAEELHKRGYGTHLLGVAFMSGVKPKVETFTENGKKKTNYNFIT